MSFEKLSKPELIAVADAFGVEASGTKATIIEALDAEGVTFELYQSLTNPEVAEPAAPVEAPAPVAEESGPETILEYTSGMGSYGNKYGSWSPKSPFVVVPKSVADKMIAQYPELFAVASESKVESFYN